MTFPTPHICDYGSERYSVREPDGVRYPWDTQPSSLGGLYYPAALAYFDIPKPGSASTADWRGYRYGYTLTEDSLLFVSSIWVLTPQMPLAELIKGNAKWVACNDKTGKVTIRDYVCFLINEPIQIEYEKIELTSNERLINQYWRLGFRLKEGKTNEEEEAEIDKEFGKPIIVRGRL